MHAWSLAEYMDLYYVLSCRQTATAFGFATTSAVAVAVGMNKIARVSHHNYMVSVNLLNEVLLWHGICSFSNKHDKICHSNSNDVTWFYSATSPPPHGPPGTTCGSCCGQLRQYTIDAGAGTNKWYRNQG